MPTNANHLSTLNFATDADFFTGASAGAFNQRSASGSFAAFVAFIVRGSAQQFVPPLAVTPEQWLWGNASGSSGWSLTLENSVTFGPSLFATAYDNGGIPNAYGMIPLGNIYERLIFAGLWFDGTNLFCSVNGVVVNGGPLVTPGVRTSLLPARLGRDAAGGALASPYIDFIGCGYSPVDLGGAAGTQAGVLGRLAGTSYKAFCESLDGCFMDPDAGIDWLHRYSAESVSQGISATTVKTAAGSRVVASPIAPTTLPDIGNAGPVSAGVGGSTDLTRSGEPTISGRKSPFVFFEPPTASPGEVPPPTATTVDLYVSPSLGNDDNPGTQALPLRTLNAAERKIPLVVAANYRIHLRAETYPLPINAAANWIRARTYARGSIEVLADEAWDPNVFVDALTGAAQAGTGATVVVSAGLVVDAYKGKSIRMTSGAANGYTRRINSNTATNINVNQSWSPAPAPGDTFRIFDPAAVIQVPAIGGITRYTAVGDSIASSVDELLLPGTVAGVVFNGVILASLGPVMVFGGSFINFLGVDLRSALILQGSQILSGLSLTAFGWGLRALSTGGTLNPILQANATFNGYLQHDTGFMRVGNGRGDLAAANVIGGAIGGISTGAIAGRCIINSTLPTLCAGSIVHDTPAGVLELRNVSFATIAGVLLTVSAGALCVLRNTCTGDSSGATSVSVSGTGKLLCQNGAPALGDAVANDWVVEGVAAFNKAALAAAGAAVLSPTNGSVAARA